jgi:hypothetical protein
MSSMHKFDPDDVNQCNAVRSDSMRTARMDRVATRADLDALATRLIHLMIGLSLASFSVALFLIAVLWK